MKATIDHIHALIHQESNSRTDAGREARSFSGWPASHKRQQGLTHVSTKFYRLAQEFELLAINVDVSDDPKRRKGLLGRMRAVIDDIDELIHQEAESTELGLASIAAQRPSKKIRAPRIPPESPAKRGVLEFPLIRRVPGRL